jgi:hypothetical protein
MYQNVPQWIRWCRRSVSWLLLAVAPAFVYYRVYLLHGKDSAYFCGDTVGAYWPDLVFFMRSIVHGDFPLWNPNDRGGFPFAYDPQPGVFYPINWMLGGFALLVGRMSFALFQFKILIHLSITILGWYAWLTRRFSKPAASVGAVAASLGCFTLQNTHFGLIWPIAWVPWLLVTLERWLETRQFSWALATAACLGAMVSAGSPPSVLYGLLVCAFFGLPLVVETFWRLNASTKRRLCLTGLCGLATTTILCFPVILGAARLTSQSVLAKRDFSYVNFGRISTQDLVGLIFPSSAGSFLYAGITVAGLAIIGVFGRFERRVTWAACVLGTLGVLLALGDNTPALAWASRVFPPVRFFRLPFRYLYLTQIALGVLAAVGSEGLLDLSRRRLRARLVLTLLIGVNVLLWVASKVGVLRLDFNMLRDAEVSALWLMFVWVAATLGTRTKFVNCAGVAFTLVVLVDLAAFVPRTKVLRPGTFEPPQNISDSALETIKSQSLNYRVWDEFAFAYRVGSRLGIRDLRGYMDPLRLAHYDAMVASLSRSPEMLERWGVRWFLTGNNPTLDPGHHRANVSRIPHAVHREALVYELPSPRPPGYFTTRIEFGNSDAELWKALERDPLGAPLQLPSEIHAPARTLSQSGNIAATLIERRTNSLAFQATADAAGWFVVNEAFFPGWLARVDGEKVPIHRVDGWIRGIQVEPGAHRIEMSFSPIDWLIAASMAVILWLCLFAAISISLSKLLYRASQNKCPPN